VTRWIPIVLGLAASAVASSGQNRSTPAADSAAAGIVETAHLTVRTRSEPIVLPADGKVTLRLEVTPKPKMHVYAPEETRYQSVSLRLEPAPGVTSGAPVFPAGERFYFAPLDETQLVFSHPFRVEQPVTVAPGGPRGPVEVRATFRYQACDDRVCYLPKNVQLRWTLAWP
jgi:Thiol:disulfide interchange protein DsbD, N-terminal